MQVNKRNITSSSQYTQTVSNPKIAFGVNVAKFVNATPSEQSASGDVARQVLESLNLDNPTVSADHPFQIQLNSDLNSVSIPARLAVDLNTETMGVDRVLRQLAGSFDHDTATGLANRVLGLLRVAQQMQASGETVGMGTVIRFISIRRSIRDLRKPRTGSRLTTGSLQKWAPNMTWDLSPHSTPCILRRCWGIWRKKMFFLMKKSFRVGSQLRQFQPLRHREPSLSLVRHRFLRRAKTTVAKLYPNVKILAEIVYCHSTALFGPKALPSSEDPVFQDLSREPQYLPPPSSWKVGMILAWVLDQYSRCTAPSDRGYR
ncbi:hypothetical protein EB093_08660 [bacterium]|nr:hypothetical protein [bacterium]